jgi:hypothetical protein
MADDDSSGRSSSGRSSRSRNRSPQEQTVLLAQIFIIKIDPVTKNIESYQAWDGRNPGTNETLIANGVKISDNTYDAYTPISAYVDKKLKGLKRHRSSHRTSSPERSFEHLRGQYPNGNCFSYLYGNLEGQERAQGPYANPGVYGRREPLQELLLPSLMTKTPRHAWRRDDFKIYASNEDKLGGRPQTCWYLVNGHDVWDENSPYIKRVSVLDIPSDPGDIKKNYRVLHTFTVSDVYSYCLSREMGPFHRKMGGGQKAGKSRRKLKLRFKRKTIKRIFKRKTIKRIFKKR